MVYEELSAAVAGGAHVLNPAPRGLVRVAGPDAGEFLHRLCSQDVAALEVGAVAPACFLTPKGKLAVVATVARLGPEDFVVEAPVNQAGREDATGGVAGLHAYLDRFHFTEKLTLGIDAELECAEFFSRSGDDGAGPTAAGAAGLDAALGCAESDGLVRIGRVRDGLQWVRVHGKKQALEGLVAASGAQPLLPATAAALRLALTEWVVGVDTDEATIALEAPVDDHISTTKGCYTGQEIVARIHTYGHVNRHVVLVRAPVDAELSVGTAVCEIEDGDPVGRLTTSAELPDGGGKVALAYVPRDFAARGTELALGDANGPRVSVAAFGTAATES